MRKMLVLTALVLFGTAMAGCKYCDSLRRGSLIQPWNAPTMPYCDNCTTCAPEAPCGACESCMGESSMTTTTTKVPIMPSPGP